MRAGRLRHQVRIQTPTKDTSPGAGDITWSDYATVWAAVEPLRGNEFFTAQQVNAEVTGRVVIRYLSGITPEVRVLFGTRTFEILSVIDVDERHEELQLMVKERVR